VLHVVDNPFKKGWNLPTIAYEEEYRKELPCVNCIFPFEMANIYQR
jgi:hypothetical protein